MQNRGRSPQGHTLRVSLSSPRPLPLCLRKSREPEADHCSLPRTPAAEQSGILVPHPGQGPGSKSHRRDPCWPGASCPTWTCPGSSLPNKGPSRWRCPGGTVGSRGEGCQQGASTHREGSWGTESKASRQKGHSDKECGRPTKNVGETGLTLKTLMKVLKIPL